MKFSCGIEESTGPNEVNRYRIDRRANKKLIHAVRVSVPVDFRWRAQKKRISQFAKSRDRVSLYSTEFQHLLILRLSTVLGFHLSVSRSRGIAKGALSEQTRHEKSAWSTYAERLNIYKQWPDGSLADQIRFFLGLR